MVNFMKNTALFGPAGNCDRFYAEGHKSTKEVFKWLHDIGLDSYEYQCGNGIRTKLETFAALGEEAKKYYKAKVCFTGFREE